MLPTFWGKLVRYVSRIITPRNWVIIWVINTFQDSSRHCLAIQEHLSTAAAHNKTFPQASEQVAKPIQPQLLQPLYTIQYYIAAPPALDPAPKALTAPLHPLAPLTKPKLSSGCSTAASHFANCQAAAARCSGTNFDKDTTTLRPLFLLLLPLLLPKTLSEKQMYKSCNVNKIIN